MPVTVGIRRGIKADIASLEELVARCFETTAFETRGFKTAGFKTEVADWMHQIGVFTYLAEDESVFGFVTVGPELIPTADPAV